MELEDLATLLSFCIFPIVLLLLVLVLYLLQKDKDKDIEKQEQEDALRTVQILLVILVCFLLGFLLVNSAVLLVI